jgi:hypothetical protein
MAHDVFVSHSSQNQTVALAICASLEARAIRCWVAPRDILPGADWAASIVGAIESAKVMVLVFSHHTNHSQQVLREVERAVNSSVTIIPFRLEEVAYSKSLSYFLASCHWLDAISPPLQERINELCERVSQLCPKNGRGAMTSADVRTIEEFFTATKKDPFAQMVLSQFRQDHVGRWCTVRKREEQYDYLQTCKMCGWSDSFEPGLTPSRCCGDCGLSEDPGSAGRWFDFIESAGGEYWNGYGEKPDKTVIVRCRKCEQETKYAFKDGPPFACPKCGSRSESGSGR